MSRVLARRFYGVAQAAPQSSSNNAARDPAKWSVESLRNGAIRLAVAPVAPRNANYAGGPSQAMLFVPAGSRHERYELGEQGLSHLLRRSIGLSTAGASGLAIVRSLQQMGATLECTSSRENLVYTLRVSQERWLADGLKFVDFTATQCHYHHWELPRITYNYMNLDQLMYKRRNFDLMLTELLHSAAFRGGDLSHSLIAPEHVLLNYNRADPMHPTVEQPLSQMECYSEERINGFVQRRVLQQPLTLVVTGLTDPFVEDLRQRISSGNYFPTVQEGKSTSTGEAKTATKFSPGDQRYEMPLVEMGMVALGWAIPGAGHKDQAAIGVLLRGLTGGSLAMPRVHWGNLPHSILWDALQAETNLPPMAVGGLHWAYSDQGLFGVQLNGLNKNGSLKTALIVIARQLKRVGQHGLKEEQLKRAKAAYRMDLLMGLETSYGAAEHIGEELSLTGAVCSGDKFVQEVDQVSLDDVKRVASQIFSKLPALSAVGDISGVPYADELSRSL